MLRYSKERCNALFGSHDDSLLEIQASHYRHRDAAARPGCKAKVQSALLEKGIALVAQHADSQQLRNDDAEQLLGQGVNADLGHAKGQR